MGTPESHPKTSTHKAGQQATDAERDTPPYAFTTMARELAIAYTAFGTDDDGRRTIAEDILRTLCAKAAVEIREVLAEALKSCPTLPRDIALTIATDVRSVSCPFLEATPALGDSDLVDVIAATSDAAVHGAIASRTEVSRAVTDALVHRGDGATLERLVNNEGADIAENAYSTILGRQPNSQTIPFAIASRDDLPPHVIDLVMDKVAEPIRVHLRGRIEDERTLERVNTLVRQSLSLARLGLLANIPRSETQGIARYLGEDHDLSPVAALCMGHFRLFRSVLARKAGVPIRNVNVLLSDASYAGLRALCGRAGLPETFYDAVELTLAAINAIAAAERKPLSDIERVPLMVLIDKLVYLAKGKSVENVDFLITMMRHHQQEKKWRPRDE